MIVWRMGAGFGTVEARLNSHHAEANRRFDKNDADHVEIFGTIGEHGENIAVLNERCPGGDGE